MPVDEFETDYLAEELFYDDFAFDDEFEIYNEGGQVQELVGPVVEMDKWVDIPATMTNTYFAIDECQRIAWRDALEEAKSLNTNLRHLLDKKKTKK
jgi:hypothetical protein